MNNRSSIAGRARAVAAALLTFTLVACGGGSTPAPPSQPSNVGGTIPGAGLLTRIVGVGDSLTAGEQSNALLGVTIAPNPLGSGSLFPVVPDTQGNGYYALLWSQANGGANPLDPAISPLPLIAPPGVGSILLPTPAGGFTSIVAPCTGPNLAALSAATALGTRLNPKTTPLDVAVPGQTLHEALFQYQPTGDPCTTYPIAQLQGLNSIVGAENLNFYPVLANFGPGTTQIAAAVRLRPTLALVWLGSNDLVKFLFSNGAVAAPDAGTFQADLTSVIAQLQAAGAKVAVANLFDVLAVPQFTPVAAIPQVLAARGVPTTLAPPIAGAIDAFLAGFGVGNGGFLTLTGAGKIVGVVQAAVPAIVGGAPPAAAIQAGFTQLQASPNAFGAGDFVVDAIAAQAAQLNVAYNAAIAAAAKSRGAALVDVHGLFGPIEANGGVYPLPSNPKCCSLQLGGGLFSNDGLHPSNTGYAVLANLFIQTVDQAYGTTIPPVNVAAINATDLYSPH